MQYLESELVRLDIVVRYLAVENFYGKNDFGFKLYAKMQDGRAGQGYSQKSVPQFLKLIESYETNGYIKNSSIKIFKNLALWDGSHRMALHLYHNLPTICADILPEVKVINYALDWFVMAGFSREECQIILDKAKELHEKSKINFTGFLWGAAMPFKIEILKDLEIFGKVGNINEYSFQSREYYNHVVRRIYAVDDIVEENIDKKIDYLKPYETKIISFNVQFSPHYRLKGKTNLPLSKSVERIKFAIREKYKKLLPTYFHDILFHLSDNQYQSDYCDLVLSPQIKLPRALSEINNYAYALAVDKTPYMPKNFPEEIPVGKDVDILVTPKDYESILNTLIQFASYYNDRYEVKVLQIDNNTRIRFERSSQLILLLDISSSISQLSPAFIEDGIKNRESCNGYFKLSRPYEYIYRMYKYALNTQKTWHLDYLLKNVQDYDAALSKKYNGPLLAFNDNAQPATRGGMKIAA